MVMLIFIVSTLEALPSLQSDAFISARLQGHVWMLSNWTAKPTRGGGLGQACLLDWYSPDQPEETTKPTCFDLFRDKISLIRTHTFSLKAKVSLPIDFKNKLRGNVPHIIHWWNWLFWFKKWHQMKFLIPFYISKLLTFDLWLLQPQFIFWHLCNIEIYIYKYIYTHMHVYTYTHTYIYTYTYVCVCARGLWE